MDFLADRRDMEFVLFEYLQIEKLLEFEKWKEFDLEQFKMVLNEAIKSATGIVAPLNASGDEEGAKLEDGQVTLPTGFKEAWEKYRDGGWTGMANSPEWGGMGFPESLGLAVGELFVGANCSFTMTPGLTRGAAAVIETFGDQWQKKTFVQKMYLGQWAGTMCLTEPQAGSAVGDVKTFARPDKDGAWSINGTKLFITSGDHDLTENIIHLVLARTPDAPAGIKGISLFIVPKYKVKKDGAMGDFNDIVCTNIEHKMGIHASPTCTLNFGDDGNCLGYLIGDINKGIMYMFHMMNEARIGVGMQGMAQASPAYQLALRYSKERVQGAHILEFKNPNARRVEIIEHPDVKRMLMTMKSLVEGCRALLYSTAFFSDMLAGTENREWENLIDLLTPVCKAYCTDMAFKVTELAIQVHGGYGYCTEYGVEQYCRDVKISSIYEGANGIQALDLVGRKLGAKGGMLFMSFLNRINVFIGKNNAHPALADLVKELDDTKNKLAEATMSFAAMGKENPLFPISYATPYLKMFGDVACAYFMLDMAVVADERLENIYKAKNANDDESQKALRKENDEAAFYHGKVQTARFFIKQLLPDVYAISKSIESQDISMLDVEL